MTLDQVLRSDLGRLLDRIATCEGAGTAVTALEPEARARIEEAEARLAAARLRLLAGYEEWERALEACADLWAVSGLRASGLSEMPDRRGAPPPPRGPHHPLSGRGAPRRAPPGGERDA